MPSTPGETRDETSESHPLLNPPSFGAPTDDWKSCSEPKACVSLEQDSPLLVENSCLWKVTSPSHESLPPRPTSCTQGWEWECGGHSSSLLICSIQCLLLVKRPATSAPRRQHNTSLPTRSAFAATVIAVAVIDVFSSSSAEFIAVGTAIPHAPKSRAIWCLY